MIHHYYVLLISLVLDTTIAFLSLIVTRWPAVGLTGAHLVLGKIFTVFAIWRVYSLIHGSVTIRFLMNRNVVAFISAIMAHSALIFVRIILYLLSPETKSPIDTATAVFSYMDFVITFVGSPGYLAVLLVITATLANKPSE